MRINAEQLHRQLPQQLSPLYAVSGNETLLVIEAADLIRQHARQQGFSDYALFTVDQHFNWSELFNTSNSPSLFSDCKLIDLRIPSGKPGKEGGKAIESYCRSLPQDTVTLITLPKLDKQSQSTQWYKAIENTGIVVPIQAIEYAQLPAWIRQRLSRQQQSVDAETLNFIAYNVEGNLLAAHQEIQKLALLYPQGQLTFDQVKNAVLNVARYDLFQLTEAMTAFDPIRYTRILSGLQGEATAPPLILATLAEQIRQLIVLRTGLDQGSPPDLLFKSARIWRSRQNALLSAARRISARQLQQSLIHAAKIDRISKGVAAADSATVWDELLQLGLNIALIDQPTMQRKKPAHRNRRSATGGR
ncbi:DNA polymerase III, delta subunit [Nitrosomonas sp. Nm51]|uniref:DNA polymerase III subunit delta n=1 Tax=Nitrosomonas sp. Nm51 TaxID=133720 RepID=UPI0008C646DB|nr:DNA polymerase III subunit delta [Nitrosomonas sp. Nm51]SER26511.1 DNA polymerase III, delta subunit [Nitrosomonas sp. Nm51]